MKIVIYKETKVVDLDKVTIEFSKEKKLDCSYPISYNIGFILRKVGFVATIKQEVVESLKWDIFVLVDDEFRVLKTEDDSKKLVRNGSSVYLKKKVKKEWVLVRSPEQNILEPKKEIKKFKSKSILILKKPKELQILQGRVVRGKIDYRDSLQSSCFSSEDDE